ncbi:MAG: hypothetical protein KME06_15350 [Kastovskya adunca ATA6-11-RM4]|jgi:hypothetical protein|nr:hypothetical protein [Kastovskya adunca ATA6-11-RM4]
MLPIFLVLLASALCGVGVLLRASHEISRLLAFGTVIICSIWAFTMAPWFIQVLILVAVLRMKRLHSFIPVEAVPQTCNNRRVD